jgi:uncharacterized protein
MIIIKRNLFQDLKEHLEKKEISLIVGARQVGKTTLMVLLKEYLEREGKNTLFLSLDNEMDKPFFESQQSLMERAALELGKKKGYVFIDEIQRKENAGIFLKGLYDLNLPYKFIVSGSGSLELKEKIHESLAGRKRFFELGPISFVEFLDFKTGYKYEKKIDDFFLVEKQKTKFFLNEYLNYGGYPRVVLEEKLTEKTRALDEVYHSYLEKDISYLLKVEKVDAFSNLIKALASQTGQIVNYNETSSLLGISLPTLKNYFWYGEKTFVFSRLTPYYKNIRKEITKSPVIYFNDLGLRNYSLGRFGNLKNLDDFGPVFENLIFKIIKEKIQFTSATAHFWRTTDKAEVDFVIGLGETVIPVEVKYKQIKKIKVARSLRSFIKKYNPEKAFIVNLTLDTQVKIDNTKVFVVPFEKLLGEGLIVHSS